MQVENVDFDPQENEYRHGLIDQAGFRQNLADDLKKKLDKSFGNRAKDVLNVVAAPERDFSAPDVPTLVTHLVDAITEQYSVFKLAGIVSKKAILAAAVKDAITTNLQRDHKTAMDEEESSSFDFLTKAANVVLSRNKQQPNCLPHANLPTPIRKAVDAVLSEIRAERGRWSLAALEPEHLAHGNFATTIIARQRGLHYQGNHTNMAGWLPAVACPRDKIRDLIHRVSPRLARKLKEGSTLADAVDGHGNLHRNRLRDEFDAFLVSQNVTNATVVESAMAALCQDVSSYIEFSLSHSISRLLYNPVSNKIYITAHYKWKDGYNPFFEIVGFGAL